MLKKKQNHLKINKHNVDLYLHEDANIDRTNKRNIVLFPIDYFKVGKFICFYFKFNKREKIQFWSLFLFYSRTAGCPFFIYCERLA
jgi:hypothetical protein